MPLRKDKTLCGTIQKLSRRTWKDLFNSFVMQLSLSEESITDYLLLDLSSAHTNQIRIKKFNRRQEGKTTGADWEWWFGSGSAWFGIRVQAKKISDEFSPSYEGLYQMAGKSGIRQVDLFIQDALSRHLFPLYCFYNYFPTIRVTPPSWTCPPFNSDYRLWGCSIADAISVREKIDARKVDFQTIAGISRPLMCIFCCPDNSSAQLALSAFEWASILSSSRETQEDFTLPGISTELPGYIDRLLGMQRNEIDRELLPDGIDGVMVIEDVKE